MNNFAPTHAASETSERVRASSATKRQTFNRRPGREAVITLQPSTEVQEIRIVAIDDLVVEVELPADALLWHQSLSASDQATQSGANS